MSFLASLFAWANAPFTIVLAVTLVFAALQMTGLLGLLAGGGDHDADADHDVDADADADHDVDADHDADADNDHDADQDQDADHDSDQQSVGHALAAGLGIGKVPLSIIWQTYAVAFAFAGIAINTIYASSTGGLPLVSLAWTLPSAAVFGYGVTRVLARALGRVISDPKQEATTKKQLVGQTGVVISSKIDGEFGEIRLRDKTGHTVRIVCRTREPSAVIAEGREVVIVDYEREGERLYVAPLDEDDEPPEPPQHRAS